MALPEGFYRCPACERTYLSATTPEKCAVCGARSSDPKRAAEDSSSDSVTDKFKLAASRAKGFF